MPWRVTFSTLGLTVQPTMLHVARTIGKGERSIKTLPAELPYVMGLPNPSERNCWMPCYLAINNGPGIIWNWWAVPRHGTLVCYGLQNDLFINQSRYAFPA